MYIYTIRDQLATYISSKKADKCSSKDCQIVRVSPVTNQSSILQLYISRYSWLNVISCKGLYRRITCSYLEKHLYHRVSKILLNDRKKNVIIKNTRNTIYFTMFTDAHGEYHLIKITVHTKFNCKYIFLIYKCPIIKAW